MVISHSYKSPATNHHQPPVTISSMKHYTLHMHLRTPPWSHADDYDHRPSLSLTHRPSLPHQRSSIHPSIDQPSPSLVWNTTLSTCIAPQLRERGFLPLNHHDYDHRPSLSLTHRPSLPHQRSSIHPSIDQPSPSLVWNTTLSTCIAPQLRERGFLPLNHHDYDHRPSLSLTSHQFI